jgi:uncharacterized protein DUF6496
VTVEVVEMPEKETIERAKEDKREGKAPSTQAGEFVREEIEHVREGKHGAKSTKQAIAIGLSKARRAGVELPAKNKGRKSTKASTSRRRKPVKKSTSRKRSRASSKALERQPRKAASRRSLSRHAKTVAHKRSHADRSRSAKKAARTRKREKQKQSR